MATKQILYKLGVKGADTTKQKLGKVDNATKRLTTSVMGLAGAYLGARGLSSAIKASIQNFIVQEDAERKLETALGRNIDGLKMYASQLQQVTRYGDEATLEGMALIGAFVREEEALKKATKATMDLAAAKGFDLRTAADLVGKTLGSTTNALTRYGIEVKGAVGSTERLESMVKNVDAAFGGMAEEMAKTTGGQIIQMKNAMGDLSEVIGGVLAPAMTSFLNNAIEGWKRLLGLIDRSPDIQGLLGGDQEIAEQLQVINEVKSGTMSVAKAVSELNLEMEFAWTKEDALVKIRKLELSLLEQLKIAMDKYKSSQEPSSTGDSGGVVKFAGDVGILKDELVQFRDIFVELDEAAAYQEKGLVYTFQELNEALNPAESLALKGISELSAGLIQATIYGQKFGDAVVASLKAIAVQLIQQAAVYMLMNLFTGGTASVGGFFNYAARGTMPLPAPTPSVSGASRSVSFTIINPIGETAWVRDTLIPTIETELANA